MEFSHRALSVHLTRQAHRAEVAGRAAQLR